MYGITSGNPKCVPSASSNLQAKASSEAAAAAAAAVTKSNAAASFLTHTARRIIDHQTSHHSTSEGTHIAKDLNFRVECEIDAIDAP
jgi:hypothetical protein